MSGVPIAPVAELVTASLAAWRLEGEVTCTDGAIVVAQAGGGKRLTIEPKPKHAMFRWMVTIEGRRRPVVSLPGVLRHLRAALDPDYAATRLRVSVASLLVPQ